MNRRALLRAMLSLILPLALLLPLLGPSPAPARANGDKIDPALLSQMAAHPTKQLPIIVEMTSPKLPFPGRPNERRAKEASDLLANLGADARPGGKLALIDATAGFANAKAIDALSRNPAVAYIHEDYTVKPRPGPAGPNATYPPDQPSVPYPSVVNADRVWVEGITGKGIAVAVLDSGIAPHQDIITPTNRLLASVNFAGDLGGMPDAGGHGTHVAGIIAGNGTPHDLASQEEQPFLGGDADQARYVGIAPGASVVDVRVLNQDGYGRASSVIRGIEWVLAHRTQYNIRILNLSFGAPARRSYRHDPLATAVEIAWKRGLVVVAAAGNDGPERGTVQTPGVDPHIITVGATDDRATVPTADDELAWFSAWGTPPGAAPKPDLVAPGRRIVSLRVPGSYLDNRFPERIVGGPSGANYFRLTGTSTSAAVVSGVVALMLERQPALSPDQVKAILIATTQPYGQESPAPLVDPLADGAGLVDAYAAVNSPPLAPANQGLRPADGVARALYPIVYGQPLAWKDPTYAGIDWQSLAWDNLIWDNLAWDNLVWDNLIWDNLIWDNLIWDNLIWDNLIWDNLIWDSVAWDALTLD